MEDLTTGSLPRHLLRTASFMLVTMLSQTLYFLVDLYWVGRLGKEAVAAVGIAGNLSFVVLSLTQVLGVGTTTLISHASGARNRERARQVFHQSLWLAGIAAVAFLLVAELGRRAYVHGLAADAATAALGDAYLAWFVPALALQFVLATMAAALRGTGAFRAPMIVQVITVAINIVLAPILIFGWGTGVRIGVSGAAIASLVAITAGILWLAREYLPDEAYLRIRVAEAAPRPAMWRPIVAIGLPAGAEFGLMAVYMFVVYAVARPFGAAAQAGFGIGLRLVQSLFLPVVALGFSVAPVAGQNVGARRFDRVRETLRTATALGVSLMVAVGIVLQFAADGFVGVFSGDPAVIAVGSGYLRIIGWGFAGSAIVFVTSSLFQALGRTLPPLLTSSVRTVAVFVPVLWLAARPGFELRVIWYLSAASVLIHAAANWLLVQRQIRLAEGAAAASKAA
jgi:putative MATE family efflux protein